MESLARPLRTLLEDAAWFARATEMKLLHVRCDAALRKSALKLLMGMEFHADNRSPYVLLEDAWRRADTGWTMRGRRLAEHWEGRRRATAEQGVELGSLAGNRPPSTDPLPSFGGWLNLVLRCVRPPLNGLVIVLAPTQIEDPDAFESELGALLDRQELSPARWIVLDVHEAPLEHLHERLGGAAMRNECVRDDGGLAQDLGAMMASVDPELPGPAKAGAAWPRSVLAPQRKGDVVPTEAQQAVAGVELTAAGISPGLVGALGQRMQQYMLAAAIQMKQANGELALQYQREACRIADAIHAGRELVLQWMVLAGYELALGHAQEAYLQYLAIAERAEQDGLPLERSQAGLALALMDAREGRRPEAAAQYARSADFAIRANAAGLAIECWRLAGHMAAESGLEERAAECWQRAIALAEDADPEVAKASSAPRAARELAERLRARGLAGHAEALEHQANRLEQGQTRAAMEGLL